MTDVIVFGEGQTEETFVGRVLAPIFGGNHVFLYPRLIPTSKYGRGGALSRDRVVKVLRNTLRQRSDTFVTTFFDLYGLPGDFPGHAEAKGDPLMRAQAIQAALHEAVVAAAECRPERFIPHIQPYEFEALLFSDPDRIADREPAWRALLGPLHEARQRAQSPEHINDGPETHPSARLKVLQPSYQKVLNGSAILEAIGLERIRAECHHFDAWLGRLERLRPLPGV